MRTGKAGRCAMHFISMRVDFRVFECMFFFFFFSQVWVCVRDGLSAIGNVVGGFLVEVMNETHRRHSLRCGAVLFLFIPFSTFAQNRSELFSIVQSSQAHLLLSCL